MEHENKDELIEVKENLAHNKLRLTSYKEFWNPSEE